MNCSPLFSVISVCLNEVDRIEQTCLSVSGQSFRDFEWIVLDGGSKDGTVDLIEKFQSEMAYFRSGSDDGVYYAMNIGLSRARGRYCIFLNGGDRFHGSNVLGDVSGFLNSEDRIVTGGLYLPNEDLVVSHNHWGSIELIRHSPPHQATFFRTDVLRSLGGFDTSYRVVADFELYWRAYRRGIPFRVIPTIVSDFYTGGLSTTADKKHRREKAQVLHRHMPVKVRIVYFGFLLPFERALSKIEWLSQIGRSVFRFWRNL